MGYGGKYLERARARELRAQAWTLNEIVAELGVSKSSVSEWVRDVEFTPEPRNRGHSGHKPHPLKVRKEAEIARCAAAAARWIQDMTERELTMFALGLYAGEGDKTGGEVAMANTNPLYLQVFLTWLRRTFDINESRLRVALYLHEGLDLNAAIEFWSDTLKIPPEQFTKPYRAVADGSIRHAKHVYGCPKVRYGDTSAKRRVLAMITAVTLAVADPG